MKTIQAETIATGTLRPEGRGALAKAEHKTGVQPKVESESKPEEKPVQEEKDEFDGLFSKNSIDLSALKEFGL